MILSAKVLWPLFPLLMLIVIVCLVWALVYAVRRGLDSMTVWLQGAALTLYLAAAVTAMFGEHGAMSAHVHRPFSLLAQLAIALGLFHSWGKSRTAIMTLNVTAWAAILGDTALHYLLTRS
jgi:hypothetical protein